MKVCLIGSAPSSVRLAPYTDESFRIWACSPGAVPHLARQPDAFFEIHRWEPDKPWFNKEYRDYLASLKTPVYMIEPVAEVPASIEYPKAEMIEKFGPFFFTSTLSWMFALAIHQGATEIHLYGVDMSAQEEWEFQRSGCHYFISIARSLGIPVIIPDESDLQQPPPLYGFREADPMHVKLLKREEELRGRLTTCEQNMQAARDEAFFLRGALDDCKYMLKTWISDETSYKLARANPPIEQVRQATPEEIAQATQSTPPVQDIQPQQKPKAKPTTRKSQTKRTTQRKKQSPRQKQVNGALPHGQE